MPDPDQTIMLSLELVTEITNWVLRHRHAMVMDVMAEFDLSPDEAFFALATAKLVIQDMEKTHAN